MRPPHGKPLSVLSEPVQTADAGGVESNAAFAETRNRIKRVGKHIRADHLKAVRGEALGFFPRLGRFAFKLRLYGLFHLAELPGDALHAVFVCQSGYPAAAVGQVFVLQIRAQFAFLSSHGNAADAEILVRFISGPGAVDGDVPG